MSDIDLLVEEVRTSGKYWGVAETLIRHIGSGELARRRTFREAVKATKRKLHQVAAVYLDAGLDFDGAADTLRTNAESGDPVAFRDTCIRIMQRHVSTRERLPILGEFYQTLLADLGPIHSVADFACGLNPLAIPWMPLTSDCRYYAYDIHQGLLAFLGRVLPLTGVQATARLANLVDDVPNEPVDVGLLLKCIPCLEQLDPSAGQRLLDRVQARRLVVSFPNHSLGGRSKGMARTYDQRFQQLVAGRPWQVRRFEFSSEIAYLVDTQSSDCP